MLSHFMKKTLVASAVGAGAGFLAYRFYNNNKAPCPPALSDPNAWKPFTLKEIENINHNTKLFRFALDSPTTPLGTRVASCILTKFEKDGKAVIRPYTPTTGPETLGHFDLVVKEYPEGNMSKHIHSLKVGDALDVKGPLLKFDYKPNVQKEIGMVAGGTGITPMYQVIKEVLQNPSDKTRLRLIYANVSEHDILLRKELDDLAAKHDNFKVHYVLDKAPAGWKGSEGYVTRELVQRWLPKPAPDTMVMVCGPPPMMAAISGDKAKDKTQGEVEGILKDLGYPKENVFKF